MSGPPAWQLRMLLAVAEGRTSREAAAHLGTTRNTVDVSLKRLYPALGARNRAHAAAIALGVGRRLAAMRRAS